MQVKRFILAILQSLHPVEQQQQSFISTLSCCTLQGKRPTHNALQFPMKGYMMALIILYSSQLDK